MAEPEIQETESLTTWLSIIYNRRKVIIVAFIAILGLSYSYINMRRPLPIYTSNATIMFGPHELEVQTREGEIIKQIYSYANEVFIIQSDAVAEKAAAIMKKRFDYQQPENELMPEIKSTLKITPTAGGRGEPGTISLSATSNDPYRAFHILSSVIDGYIEQKKEDEDKFFKDTYTTFSKQLDIARENLNKAESTLTDFIVNNKEIAEAIKNYGLAEEGATDELSVDLGINEKYLKIKSEVLEREGFINTIKELVQKDRLAALTVLAKKYDYLVDVDLKKALQDKEEELNSLLMENEEAHPAVRQTRGELKSIEKKIDVQIASAIKTLEVDLNILKAQEKEFSQLIGSDLHRKILAYNSLKKDIKVKNDIYNKLAEQLQQLDLGEKIKRGGKIRVVEPPRLPSSPSNTIPASRKIALSFVIAVFGCLALVYILEMVDTSIRDVEQLERLIDLPVLATIPSYKKPKARRGLEKGKRVLENH